MGIGWEGLGGKGVGGDLRNSVYRVWKAEKVQVGNKQTNIFLPSWKSLRESRER